MANIAQKLLSLKPSPIDPTKCTPSKSLYEQIIKNCQATSERQAQQFNLGNTHSTANPIDAADFILEREYGESSLFIQGEHTSVFIPPTFVSHQYMKDSSVAILDYEVKTDIERLLDNLKHHSPMSWLTNDLTSFMQTQTDDFIEKKAFDQWILKMKIKYLVIEELKTDQASLLQTTLDTTLFIRGCITELKSANQLSSSSSVSLETLFSDFLSGKYTNIAFKRKIASMVETYPPTDSNLCWIFGLVLAELGEKLEHWFYDQLSEIKDDVLQDTVVLSSLYFLTNMQNKMHKETDFLIISWERKLVISVEMKRSLADDKVFKQLESNHRIFEEKLGDQLKSCWTYFPCVCVEDDTLSINSQHYITMQTEIKLWLSSVLNRFPTTKTAKDEVKDLLKILIFGIHVSKKDQVAPITSSTWVEYTTNAIENVSTSHNILFYSNQQIAIMNNDDPRSKYVMICGPFGVRKSLLLQQKAVHLNEQPKYKGKVIFIVENRGICKMKSMLYNRSKVDLEENRGVFVDEIDVSKSLHSLSFSKQFKGRTFKKYRG